MCIMDESHRHMLSIRNQTQKHDSTPMKRKSTQNYSVVIEVRIVVTFGWGDINLEVTQEEAFWSVGNALYIQLNSSYIIVYLKNSLTCPLKIWAISMLYLNKFFKTRLVWIFRCFNYFTALFPSIHP